MFLQTQELWYFNAKIQNKCVVNKINFELIHFMHVFEILSFRSFLRILDVFQHIFSGTFRVDRLAVLYTFEKKITL